MGRWGTQLKNIKDKTGSQLPEDKQNIGQSLARGAEKGKPGRD